MCFRPNVEGGPQPMGRVFLSFILLPWSHLHFILFLIYEKKEIGTSLDLCVYVTT
jgi:hypothetical protein